MGLTYCSGNGACRILRLLVLQLLLRRCFLPSTSLALLGLLLPPLPFPLFFLQRSTRVPEHVELQSRSSVAASPPALAPAARSLLPPSIRSPAPAPARSLLPHTSTSQRYPAPQNQRRASSSPSSLLLLPPPHLQIPTHPKPPLTFPCRILLALSLFNSLLLVS